MTDNDIHTRALGYGATAKTVRKSITKSDEQARQGNLPYLIARRPGLVRWHVLSRTIGGLVYEVDDTGDDIHCDCQGRGWCWHLTAALRAEAGLIGHIDATERRAGRMRSLTEGWT